MDQVADRSALPVLNFRRNLVAHIGEASVSYKQLMSAVNSRRVALPGDEVWW